MYEYMSGQLFNKLLIGDKLSLRSSGNIFLHLLQNRSPFVLLSRKYLTLRLFNYLLYFYTNRNAFCFEFLFITRNLKYTYYIAKVRWLNVSYSSYNLNAIIMFNALFCLLASVKIIFNIYLCFCPILGVPYILLSAMLIFINHYYGYA